MMLSLPTQIIPAAGASTEVAELSQSARSTSDCIAKGENGFVVEYRLLRLKKLRVDDVAYLGKILAVALPFDALEFHPCLLVDFVDHKFVGVRVGLFKALNSVICSSDLAPLSFPAAFVALYSLWK
jgi:hypothetical protein